MRDPRGGHRSRSGSEVEEEELVETGADERCGNVSCWRRERASQRGEEFTGEFTTWERNINLGLVRSLTRRHMSPGFTSTNTSTVVQGV